MSPITNHKRSRLYSQKSSFTAQQRLITAGCEPEIEEPRSDSEYDSDVIVVGKARKCPRVSETPSNHAPSTMRMSPAPQTSPRLPSHQPLQTQASAPEPAMLEWHPQSTHDSCLHETEIQQLRSRVGYLELEALSNIDLRAELHQDYCRVLSEVWDLREIVRDLVNQQKWDDLRKKHDEEERRVFETVVKARIAFAETNAIHYVSRLRCEIKGICKKGFNIQKIGTA
jgi:hypothetical protein